MNDYTNLKYPDELGNELRNYKVILIVGDLGTGKTTEAVRLAKHIGKDVQVIAQHHHEADLELFRANNYPISFLDFGVSIQPILEKLPNHLTIILDDIQGYSKKNIDYVKAKLYTDIRHRDFTLIYIFHHPKYIPTPLLGTKNSFLIIKVGANFTVNRLSYYLKVKGIRSAIYDYINKYLVEYNSLYLFHDGKYSNGYEMREFEPRTKYNRDVAYFIIGELAHTDDEEIYVEIDERLVRYTKFMRFQDVMDCSKSQARLFVKEYESIYGKTDILSRKTPRRKSIELGLSDRIKSHIYIDRYKEPLEFGDAKGTKIDGIKKLKVAEELGNIATRIIGDTIEDILKDRYHKLGESSYLMINEGRSIDEKGSADIIIESERRIEVEVKNYSTHKYLTSNIITNKVLPRYSGIADANWLFVCGIICNKDAKRILKDNNVHILNLTRNQITEPDSAQRRRIRNRLVRWLDDI